MRAKHLIAIFAITVAVLLCLNAVAYAGWWDFLTKTRDDRRETGAGPTVAVRG